MRFHYSLFTIHYLLIFKIIPLVFLFGCSSEFNLATKKEETLIYNTDKDVAVGDAVSAQLEKQYKVLHDIDVNQRVQQILARITPVCDRKELFYIIRVLDVDEVNAVSLPGGYIYVFKGLIEAVQNDDQLASVIAHEVGHITARHAMKRMQASYQYMLMQLLAIQSGDSAIANGVNAAYATAFTAYSQQDEFEADHLGLKYMTLAGYKPEEMVGMLKVLQKKEQKGPLREISYWRTHPYIPERIAMLNTEIHGSMRFSDYLNLTGNRK